MGRDANNWAKSHTYYWPASVCFARCRCRLSSSVTRVGGLPPGRGVASLVADTARPDSTVTLFKVKAVVRLPYSNRMIRAWTRTNLLFDLIIVTEALLVEADFY